ncbi:MAG: DUF58 domain-containing protein [Sulfuricurvum sp.]|uniref:DUF58 domain-containing protein n=1 Tax=Sulfuricurvum sp. TaxID=2025608 RepID=UPI0025D97ADF|nr:DUF58 domain-containing protein [Sulfuricurvum sp.]MCK9373150.1 DUF58 domain-containing protein [Sulfuricurvum sp.]
MNNSHHILLKARRQIIGDRIGNNPSLFRGEGYDFIELHEYIPGDDTRHIDWNITAKMQRPYVKVFREERELSVVTVAMLGGSLHFGRDRFKIESVAEAVALIGYSALSNGDLFTHYNFSETLVDEVRPSKKRFAVAMSVERVMGAQLLRRHADYNAMAATLYRRVKRRSLIVIIGDFFEIPDLRLLAKKHEVVALVVRDRLEEKPEPMGYTSLIDPETGILLEGDFNGRNVKRYAQKIREHDAALFERFQKVGIRSAKLYTDANVSVTLRRIFEGRV